jgi:hypothetical protein
MMQGGIGLEWKKGVGVKNHTSSGILILGILFSYFL